MDNQSLENLFNNQEEQPIKPDNLEKSTLVGQPAPELTNEQKMIVLKMLELNPQDPPSILEIMEALWPEKKGTKGWDARHKDGRLLKSYISTLNLDTLNITKPTTAEYKLKPEIILTDQQKEYIRNNINMTALEQAEVIFNKQPLYNTNQETRIVLKYRKELKEQGVVFEKDNQNDDFEEYRPPVRIEHACARINKHVEGITFDSGKLTPNQKKQAISLMHYLSDIRFIHQINLINNQDDKKLFENTYIKYIYDKSDLTQEDLDQYIILANEAVMDSSIQRTIALLEREQERSLDNDGKISMAIVEALKTSRDEHNSCIKRIQSLLKNLTEERSEKIKGKLKETASILNLIELWKNEETRIKMIKIANQKKEKLKEEIDRLSNMDDIICTIAGLDRSEILNN